MRFATNKGLVKMLQLKDHFFAYFMEKYYFCTKLIFM